MTIAEYMSGSTFPLTTLPDAAGFAEQMATDALRHDNHEGHPPNDPRRTAEYEELRRKVAAWDDPVFKAESARYFAALGRPGDVVGAAYAEMAARAPVSTPAPA